MHGPMSFKYMNFIKLNGDHTPLTNSFILKVNSFHMCHNKHATLTYTFSLLLTVYIDDFLFYFMWI